MNTNDMIEAIAAWNKRAAALVKYQRSNAPRCQRDGVCDADPRCVGPSHRDILNQAAAELDRLRDENKRLAEGIMRCVDAGWRPNCARDWSRPELILAEYLSDIRGDGRCGGRYPVPQTSPPRDEPFDVTYRCALAVGHAGPCGVSERLEPIAESSVERLQPMKAMGSERGIDGEDVGEYVALLRERDELLAALMAARDVLVGYQKHAGYLPEQGGYSTRMTDAEHKLTRAVSDLDAIIAKAEGK